MQLRRAVVIATALAALAGCAREASVNRRPHTGTGTASLVDGVQQVVITTGADLRFHPSTIVVHRGRVQIVLVNTSKPGAGAPHDIQMTGLPGASVPLAAAGETRSVTFDAPEPGTYSFVCSIHANQGQTGKLIVR